MRNRAFTLLELVVGIALLSLATAGVGWKIHYMVKKSHFQSDMEKFRSRMFTCRQLALNMQADWVAVLEQNREGKWRLHTSCVEQIEAPKLLPLVFSDFSLSFNEKKVHSLSLNFCSSGEVVPQGEIRIVRKGTTPLEQKFRLFEREKEEPSLYPMKK